MSVTNGSETPFDYVECLASQRDAVVASVQAQGGVDLASLGEPEPGNKGNGIEFFSLHGLTFDGVALGFKRYRANARFGYYAEEGFILDTATLAFIGRHGEKYKEMLPKVHYEVRDVDEPLGILTEDFSRHGELYFSGSNWLAKLPDMFDNPNVVDDDNLQQVVGHFQSYNKAPVRESVRKIMDVWPLYDTSIIFSTDTESGYAEWFANALAIQSVGLQIPYCRIDASEIAA